MRNKFVTGFISGLAGAILLFAIAFTLYTTQANSNNELLEANDNKNTESTVNAADTVESDEEILEKVNKLELLIDKYYLKEVDQEALADGIYKGVMKSLGDPYSTYYTEDEYKALEESSKGIYSGIGASVSQDVTTGVISVVKPFVTGPAYEAGLLPGDILYKVNDVEVTGMDLTEVVSRIKGKEGTNAILTVIREGNKEPMELSIPRRTIEVPTIEYEMLDNSIGYISISEFDEVTAEQFRSAIEDLDKQGQKGLVIDVRNNPGGLLDTVVDMLNRMLPEGLIVYTEDKYGIREEKTSDGKEEFNKPVVVLINGNSASASEIFAGAMQDYEKATIVGTTSFGKGIVQSIIPLRDGTAIKITVSKYFTPKGQDIHGVGIQPDVTVELDEALQNKVVVDKAEDNQLQKAMEILNSKTK